MTRVGIAGCGAVAQIYYRPALLTLEKSETLLLVAAFDPDRSAASTFIKGFKNAAAVASFDELIEQRLDLLIIASPPSFHCEQSIAAMRKGIRVHCEKPLATSVQDGERMVEEAEKAGTLLSVGMIRRRLAPARAIHSLLSCRAIGRLNSIDIFEGGPFRWPVSSPAYFDPALGAQGVLEDIGSHVLDLLVWWLGVPDAVAYSDDAMGGVAANCSIELRYNGTLANVRLSRDWYRPNQWRLSGDEGWISWNLDEWDSLELAMAPRRIKAKLSMEELQGAGAGASDRSPTFKHAFVDQLAELAGDRETASYVSGTEALQVLRIFERCAKARTPMEMPWLI